MFGFFNGVALEGFCDFRIAFAVGLARHGQIHAYFGAFAFEVCAEVSLHFVIGIFCNADHVFGHEFESCAFVKFLEF